MWEPKWPMSSNPGQHHYRHFTLFDISACYELRSLQNFSKWKSLPGETWMAQCSGESTRQTPWWPELQSWTRRPLWVRFVFVSPPYSGGFSPSTKFHTPDSNSISCTYASPGAQSSFVSHILPLKGATSSSVIYTHHLHTHPAEDT